MRPLPKKLGSLWEREACPLRQSKKSCKPDLSAKVESGVFTTLMTNTFLPQHELTAIGEDPTEADDSSSIEQPPSWKSAGREDHNLAISAPDDESNEEEKALALSRILVRAKQLPGTSYFSSNHVMVNNARTYRMIAPLRRSLDLDKLAREHAEAMAAKDKLFHSRPLQLQSWTGTAAQRLGENIASGSSIRQIHNKMMERRSGRNIILDKRFTTMGMGTAKGPGGVIYLCQLYSG